MYDMAGEAKWTQEDVIWSMLLLVPVGLGARRTWKMREQSVKLTGGTMSEQGKNKKHATKVHRPGQRSIAISAFGQAKRDGRIVVGDDGIVRLRGK